MNTKVVGRRVVALIVDVVLISGINFLIFLAFAGDKLEAYNQGDLQLGDTTYVNLTLGDTQYAVFGSKAGAYFLITLAIGIGYFVVLQGLRGLTLGKALVGIRVVREDGVSMPGVGRAFARWFLVIADAFPYLIPYLTGFIVAMVNKSNKRIGDMVAGTIVVTRDSIGTAPATTGLEGDPAAPTWVDATRGA